MDAGIVKKNRTLFFGFNLKTTKNDSRINRLPNWISNFSIFVDSILSKNIYLKIFRTFDGGYSDAKTSREVLKGLQECYPGNTGAN
jgi:hypothetical protein